MNYLNRAVCSNLRINRRTMLAGAGGLIASQAFAERAIPDDNLAYPVMVTLKLNNGTWSQGSGFYLNRPNGLYFVTARHVIFTQKNGEVPDAKLELMSTPRIFRRISP